MEFEGDAQLAVLLLRAALQLGKWHTPEGLALPHSGCPPIPNLYRLRQLNRLRL